MKEHSVEALVEEMRNNPVLVQTEVTYGCPQCFTPIPASMTVDHAKWHVSLIAAFRGQGK